MSNQHKHPTISFRISDAERKQIEARILASGMMKKDYFVRSCIYNRICVVGKKETIYPLVQTVNALYLQLLEIQKAFTNCCNQQNLSNLPTNDEIKELQTDYNNMLTAIIDLLDGAKYLWEGEHHETKSPHLHLLLISAQQCIYSVSLRSQVFPLSCPLCLSADTFPDSAPSSSR